jgi:hypothetical protein
VGVTANKLEKRGKGRGEEKGGTISYRAGWVEGTAWVEEKDPLFAAHKDVPSLQRLKLKNGMLGN